MWGRQQEGKEEGDELDGREEGEEEEAEDEVQDDEEVERAANTGLNDGSGAQHANISEAQTAGIITHARTTNRGERRREGGTRGATSGNRRAQRAVPHNGKKQDAKGHALRTPQGRRRERKSGDLAAHARAGNKNEAGCLITHGANSKGEGGR